MSLTSNSFRLDKRSNELAFGRHVRFWPANTNVSKSGKNFSTGVGNLFSIWSGVADKFKIRFAGSFSPNFSFFKFGRVTASSSKGGIPSLAISCPSTVRLSSLDKRDSSWVRNLNGVSSTLSAYMLLISEKLQPPRNSLRFFITTICGDDPSHSALPRTLLHSVSPSYAKWRKNPPLKIENMEMNTESIRITLCTIGPACEDDSFFFVVELWLSVVLLACNLFCSVSKMSRNKKTIPSIGMITPAVAIHHDSWENADLSENTMLTRMQPISKIASMHVIISLTSQPPFGKSQFKTNGAGIRIPLSRSSTDRIFTHVLGFRCENEFSWIVCVTTSTASKTTAFTI